MTDLFQTSGTSPTEFDFICENHGSLFLLIPRRFTVVTRVYLLNDTNDGYGGIVVRAINVSGSLSYSLRAFTSLQWR
jgi:hypothetical protein